jgi:hypothetical protein
MDIVQRSRKLMYTQTKKNKAPAWLLTELAVQKGTELAKKYKVDEKLVVTALYLAHTVFSPVWDGEVQQHHPELSAKFVKPYLNKWGISQKEQEIILNSIETHHAKVPGKYKISEVVRNAECFKFVTLKGSLIWLHECGLRGYPWKESVDKVLQKMEQKRKLLTLQDCKKIAETNCKIIRHLFQPMHEKALE